MQNLSGDQAAAIIGPALAIRAGQIMDALCFRPCAATSAAPGGISNGFPKSIGTAAAAAQRSLQTWRRSPTQLERAGINSTGHGCCDNAETDREIRVGARGITYTIFDLAVCNRRQRDRDRAARPGHGLRRQPSQSRSPVNQPSTWKTRRRLIFQHVSAGRSPIQAVSHVSGRKPGFKSQRVVCLGVHPGASCRFLVQPGEAIQND